MNKEFIPYEQASVLKELGFDEPCFGYTDGGGHLMIKEMPLSAISAPTFSQAFRWFRDNHNLNHEIGCGKSQFFFRIGKIDWFPDVLDDNNRRYYNSYEEAELACLKKLIEIVKNGKRI